MALVDAVNSKTGKRRVLAEHLIENPHYFGGVFKRATATEVPDAEDTSAAAATPDPAPTPDQAPASGSKKNKE